MAGSAIRYYLDLIEAAQSPWGISRTNLFDTSLKAMLAKVPDLRDRLKRFIDIKIPNPIGSQALVGKHDRPFTAELAGFWHCHLAKDLILIYRLHARSVQLVLLCQHAEIEGRHLQTMSRKLERV
jgi:mRNA-degrading endonuclease YafQ of YafQ-DinJ toxin-antitoxin module